MAKQRKPGAKAKVAPEDELVAAARLDEEDEEAGLVEELDEEVEAEEEEDDEDEDDEDEDEGHYHLPILWCVKVPAKIAKGGELRLLADGMTVDDGVLVFYETDGEEENHPTYALAPGQWTAAYAADDDGNAIALEDWPPESDDD
ncbi:MAG: hypothetical protein ACYC4L_16730 [Chloroflexota bacterium]